VRFYPHEEPPSRKGFPAFYYWDTDCTDMYGFSRVKIRVIRGLFPAQSTAVRCDLSCLILNNIKVLFVRKENNTLINSHRFMNFIQKSLLVTFLLHYYQIIFIFEQNGGPVLFCSPETILHTQFSNTPGCSKKSSVAGSAKGGI